jgi:aerobic carbon-monoxide dehydrogenase small subunit
MEVHVTANGEAMKADIEPRVLLVHLVRDHLGLTGTHWGCDTSNCGACVLHLDGVPVKSCTVLGVMAEGRRIDTVEGLETAAGLDPIQQAFMECHGLQCGFCTPGMMMVAKTLLESNPNPTEHEIRVAISGQLCRCTGYDNIVKSIQKAGETMQANKQGVSA